MFNRVGNLTILSLAKKRNLLIENLHNQPKNSTFRPDFKNQNLDGVEDYSSIRIYWKYDKNSVNQPKQKGFYLFKNDKVSEVGRNDYVELASAVSRRTREHLPIRQSMMQGNDVESKGIDQHAFW